MTWKIPDNWQKAYEEVVTAALYDNNIFSQFRRLEGYKYIMSDSMPQNMAQALYDEITPNQHLLDLLQWAKRTDNIGAPELRIPFGTSPRNLRYIYTAYLIQTHFEHIHNVVEIGVGYGGLCWVMHGLFEITHYTLLDMPNVRKLAIKVLSCFKETSNIEQGYSPYDLTVSECAVTELDWPDVKQYYNDYIQHSRHFLIRSNYHTQAEFDRFMALLNKDFTVQILPLWPHGSIEKVCGRILLGTKNEVLSDKLS